MSPPLAVYYFEAKDRLLAEALAYADVRSYDEMVAQVAGLRSARDRLVHLIEWTCPTLLDPGASGRWILWIETWTRALRDPVVARQRQVLDQRWRDTIEEIVREGGARREFAVIDVDDFVLRLAATIDGLVIQVLLGDPAIDPRSMRDVVVGMAARELGFESSTAHAERHAWAGDR